jgi:hypothetical protein
MSVRVVASRVGVVVRIRRRQAVGLTVEVRYFWFLYPAVEWPREFYLDMEALASLHN